MPLLFGIYAGRMLKDAHLMGIGAQRNQSTRLAIERYGHLAIIY
jgi:hypothetical protein